MNDGRVRLTPGPVHPITLEPSPSHVVVRSGTDLTDVAWSYDDPFPAVADVEGHVAFYTDQVTVTATARESADGPRIHRRIDRVV